MDVLSLDEVLSDSPSATAAAAQSARIRIGSPQLPDVTRRCAPAGDAVGTADGDAVGTVVGGQVSPVAVGFRVTARPHKHWLLELHTPVFPPGPLNMSEL